jgi:hypothetical protein
MNEKRSAPFVLLIALLGVSCTASLASDTISIEQRSGRSTLMSGERHGGATCHFRG